MMERKMCHGCPFDLCSEESEKAQNLGCLPSPYEILVDMKETDKNWACHSSPRKICNGLLNFVDYMNQPINLHLRGEQRKNSHIPASIDFDKELLTVESIHY